MIRAKILPAVLVSLVLVCSPVGLIAAEPSEQPVAKVGSMIITQQDHKREIQKLIPMQVSYHGGVKPEKLEKVKAEALQNLVDRSYKFQYALKEEIALEPQEFDEAWSVYIEKKDSSKVSREELAKARAGFYQELLAKRAEEVAVDAKVAVTEDQIKAYYDENSERFMRPRLYTASHIFLKVDPSALLEEKAKRKKLAEDLYAKAVAGEDFYNLAYYNSDDRTRYVGGSLGQFHAGQTVREFDSALSAMKAGEVSGPIQTIYGYHIIKLDAVEESRQLSFDEVSGLLQQQVSSSKRKAIYDAWMSELQETFPLEVYDKE
jgi:parvulin-like peptidyl-prolyl isomerase